MTSLHRLLLIGILTANLLLGIGYSILTPIFETPDEMWHYAMVQHLTANGFALPVLGEGEAGPWAQEGGQPPLYYMLAALGTLFIDTADFPAVRQVNPHADLGLMRADGNINVVMHDPAREALPWYGTVLAVHVARLFSALLGVGTVLTTFLIGREVFPEWPEVALGAAALNAFLPMFLFISGAVNNDNLSNLLAGLMLWQIARLVNARSVPGWGVYATLGVTLGAAMLAKLSLGFLLPLVGLALLAVSLRVKDWRPLVIGGSIVGGLTVLIAGWWYLRNVQLYGDPTGLDAFLGVIGVRSVPADLAQLWSERDSFLRSWWGLFGSMDVPLPEALYTVFNTLGGAGLIGFAAYVLARLVGRTAMPLRGRILPLLLIVAWPVVAFIALLRWTSITWASQGRLMFIAIGPISLWMAVGLMWWWRRRWQPYLVGGVAALFLMVAVVAPFAWIQPAYALPPLDDPLPAVLPGTEQDFYEPGGSVPVLRLRGYEVQPTSLRPGETLTLTLYWEVLQPPSRRWSLFVHVLDSADLIVAQRDRYPGWGLLATERLIGGERWSESVVVEVPDAAYAPDVLQVALGLYDLATGERMLLTAAGGDQLLLEPVITLQPSDDSTGIPNPRHDDFGGVMVLRGYEVSARRAAPGDAVTVTLYWEGQRRIERDYTVFVHVLDPVTTTIYGGSDAYPATWAAPTSTWTPGETVVDAHTFTLDPETPPGVYQIEVGVYWMPEDGVFERLRVAAPYGGQSTDVVYLSQMAVNSNTGGDAP